MWLAIKTKRRGKVFFWVFLFLFLLFWIKWFALKKATLKILNLDKLKIVCENKTVPKFNSKSIERHCLILTRRHYELFAWSFRLSRGVRTHQQKIREHLFQYQVFTLNFGFKISRHATKTGRFHSAFTHLRVNSNLRIELPLPGRFARKTSVPQRQKFHTDDVKAVRT